MSVTEAGNFQSRLAAILDGIADVSTGYPFPKTLLAELLGEIIEDANRDMADPRMHAISERVLSATREWAAAEHFQ
ncbi:hypothetical protein [uncultured Sphingomonas sp.]|uniref:hypothetical protein n=1 Tax=uncultured Sphingomonas sp. TaxID=158754 RepID=UPI0030D7BFA1